MGIRITTNWHRRPVLDSWDIPADVRSEFDYVDWSACDDGRDSVSFVHAYGTYWDLNDVEPGPAAYGGRMPESLSSRGWSAYVSDTYFSGTVFRYVFDSDDVGEYDVIVGRYYAYDEYGPDEDGRLRVDEFADKYGNVFAVSTTADNRVASALTRTQYIRHDAATRAYVIERR